MQVLTTDEYRIKKAKIISDIRKGAIFIYPTDTIYGIGCNALNNDAVKKIRRIKGNFERPFSVMVPDKQWIMENCEIYSSEEDWFGKLPGPYTLILSLLNLHCVAPSVSDKETLGVRIPDHWCTEIARLAQVPIITTSANLSGGMFMTSLETLHDEIRRYVDFMIDVGEIRGRPSTIVNMSEAQVIER